jgi:aurora kinase
LKKRNLIHRDLKLENILLDINEKEEITAKISDLGWVCQHFSENRMTLCGTPECNKLFYIDLSPEMLSQKGYNFSVDIWALGIMLFELLTGFSPFTSNSPDLICEKVKNYSSFQQIQDQLITCLPNPSELLLDLLSKLLETDPSKRTCIEDVITHPWLQINMEKNN